MGDYTKLVFDAKILPGNEDIEKFFASIDEALDLRHIRPIPTHTFFTLPRWHMVFRGCGPHTTGRFWHYPADEYDRATVHINSCLKNYNEEIQTFFDWAYTWAEPEYIYGYVLDEYKAPKWITHEGVRIFGRTEIRQ